MYHIYIYIRLFICQYISIYNYKYKDKHKYKYTYTYQPLGREMGSRYEAPLAFPSGLRAAGRLRSVIRAKTPIHDLLLSRFRCSQNL